MKPSFFDNFSSSNLLRWVFILAAFFLSLSIFLKTVCDLDTKWDSLWYHLPFAARLWGIIPESNLQFSPFIENRYIGFPLLAEYLQGMAWYITGRPESSNLVGFLALMGYLVFLRWYFRVPLYLGLLALLAIPAVHIHASLSYVDLIGNLAVTTLLMIIFALFADRRAPTFLDIALATLAAAVAVHTRFPLIPITGLGLAVLVSKTIWPLIGSPGASGENRGKKLALLAFVLPLAFFTPLKNVFQHGNPFFPVQVEIAGIVLPGTWAQESLSPGPLMQMPRSQRWLYSVFELSPSPFLQPIWTVDQWTKPTHPGYLMGGTFGVYMLFNLAFLIWIAWRFRSSEVKTGLYLLSAVSLVTSLLPESHVLRFYMFWPIFLVSINLSLLQIACQQNKIINRFTYDNLFGAVALLAVLVVVARTDGKSTFPKFASVNDYINMTVDFNLVNQLSPGENICFVGEFFEAKYLAYAIFFKEKSDHSIHAVYEKSDCGDYRVVERLIPDSH